MKIIFLPVMLLMMALHSDARIKIIAHRGYWNYEGGAQNSVEGLLKADALKIYGSEFDVYMTLDSVLVVNHDRDIDGIIIEQEQYEAIKDKKLPNGEPLPLLEDYLRQGATLQNIKLILELKPHATEEKEVLAVKKVTEMVQRLGLENRTEYISFSLTICREIIKYCPDASVAYLKGDMSPKALKALGVSGIDYHFKILKEHPEWIAEAHREGMTVNTWTVNEPADMRAMQDLKVDLITTDRPIELKDTINK